jgi:transcriptional regulator with XRE-family HTH domain
VRDLPNDPDPWLADRLREIGDRVRAERLHQNLTQEAVHLAARIDRRTYQALESGQNVTLSTVLRVAHVLDVPLRDLM